MIELLLEQTWIRPGLILNWVQGQDLQPNSEWFPGKTLIFSYCKLGHCPRLNMNLGQTWFGSRWQTIVTIKCLGILHFHWFKVRSSSAIMINHAWSGKGIRLCLFPVTGHSQRHGLGCATEPKGYQFDSCILSVFLVYVIFLFISFYFVFVQSVIDHFTSSKTS